MRILVLYSDHLLIVVMQDEGWVEIKAGWDAAELWDKAYDIGRSRVSAARLRTSHQMKWGPHSNVTLASLEGPSTLLAVEESMLGCFNMYLFNTYLLLVCSDLLFLHKSDLVGCIFLGMHPFLLGCSVCWHIILHGILWSFLFLWYQL